MLFGRYTFKCRLQNKTLLPRYKGSTFRGVFGHALKRIACVLKTRQCDSCPLAEQCLYALVFETQIVQSIRAGSRSSAPPHPFVIEPPLTQKQHWVEGELIECSLLLFGEVNEQIPYFVYAFEEMGEIGLGKTGAGARGNFELVEVLRHGEVIYSETDGKLRKGTGPVDIQLDALEDDWASFSRVKVVMETPLRVKLDNRLLGPELPFHVLVRATLRRVSSLFAAWGGGEPDLDYRGLVERAHRVKIVDSNLKWFDWQRYSNRQERKMFMGGITGSVTYEGDLGEFIPLLKLCQEFHIGKATSFGLGKAFVIPE